MKTFAKIALLLFTLVSTSTINAATVSCTSAADTQFVPNWGQVYVNQDQYSKYIYQWVYWDSYARLAWFSNNGDSTYEPDALFYGYGASSPYVEGYGNNPPNSSTVYGYFPRNVLYGHGDFGYWSSDLPSPYQDTAFGDDTEEWAVTVGSAQAVLIYPQRVYYTVTRMFDGGASSGKVKLSSQRGRRVPIGDYSKWGSYGCAESPNNVFTLPWGSNFVAPGCRVYWYKWDISTDQAC